ncbi:MAG: ADP-ribosylglycohydrolase family protein [Flammeovirgaceae bacterium]
MSILQSTIKGAIFGLAVGDALGVPVEFRSRESLKASPVTEMGGYGTHNQPPGTWSDDSSMTFCLMESLCNGYDLKDLGHKFQEWLYHAYWTPHGEVFDHGNATAAAIKNLRRGIEPIHCGGMEEDSNGNGSLMRILPLAFYVRNHSIAERFQLTKEVSSVTHAHFRSVLGCFIYIELALALMKGKSAEVAYHNMRVTVNAFIQQQDWNQQEVNVYNRVLVQDISSLPEDAISGSGYVLHALEASIWCLLTADTYQDTVLKAVNLGEDTDTTAAIAGGIAGILYGYEAIPAFWIAQLARMEDIQDLIDRFAASL